MGIWKGTTLHDVKFVSLAVIAVLRGILHYGEQACNHYIAFKLLGTDPSQSICGFKKALSGKTGRKRQRKSDLDHHNDIELLEVFYAHTISPIAIAFLTSLIMEIFFIGRYHILMRSVWRLRHIFWSEWVIPLWNARKRLQKTEWNFATGFGESKQLSLLTVPRGLDETIQYGCRRESGRAGNV